MQLRKYRSKVISVLITALVTSSLTLINIKTATAITPVGDANSAAWVINNTPQNLQIATDNSASAVAIPSNSTTTSARSNGLAAISARSASGTGQTATVRLSGVLSLYTLSGTNVAFVANGGTFSSPTSISNFTPTITSTAAAFVATATQAAVTQGILWTAPSTAGTYTVSVYRPSQTTTYQAISSTVFDTGTKFGEVTVTVGGSHPVVGGTNAADTFGATNGSMFVAVAANTGVTGVIHALTEQGVGEDSALSKGLLAKDTSITTAQTATVLAGGVLSLYGMVSTSAAFSASGGTFSGTAAGLADEVVTYSSSNRASVVNSDTFTNALTSLYAPASAVATLWTAPTTAGTYTVSLLTGWVLSSTGTYAAPTTSSLPPTLAAKITVTVVAASGGGSYSATYSACNTNTLTLDTTTTYPSGVDSTGIVADGGAWYIDFDLNDAYNANLAPGNIVATATNGALVNIGTNAGATPTAGTASTDTNFSNGSDHTLIITQPTAGAPLTTTVTLSYNGTVFCTKTVTIRGKVASLEVGNVGTQNLSSSTGSSIWIESNAGTISGLPAGTFTVVAKDSAGNIVSTDSTLGTYAAVASTLTTTVQAISVGTRSTTASTSTYGFYNVGAWTCGAVAGSSSVKIKFTTTATGEAVESPAFTARCASAPYTYTASFDKASYKQGDIAKLTVQFLDSKGNKSNSVSAPGASTLTLPMLTSVDYASSATAVTKADGSLVFSWTVGTTGTFTAGSYAGIVNYSGLTAQVPATVNYTVTSGGDTTTNADILKSIVALIASINKQIQALQKLILRR